MSQAAALRVQIEKALQDRIPAALSPRPAGVRECIASGIGPLDELMQGGLPVGALAEMTGPECSGRTTAALSFLAEVTAGEHVCAWIDVADALDPQSAAASGVDLRRLLWVRCAGLQPASRNGYAQVPTAQNSEKAVGKPTAPVPAGGGSPHPRSEGRGMSQAIDALLAAQPRPAALPAYRNNRTIGTPGAPNRPVAGSAVEREEQIPTDRLPPRRGSGLPTPNCKLSMPIAWALLPAEEVPTSAAQPVKPSNRSSALDRALRSTDLLLQAGGFRAIVLDLGSASAEQAWRVPMATWFRFRAACELSRTSLLLLTQHPCTRSSAELVLHMQAGIWRKQGNVMSGVSYNTQLERLRQHHRQNNVIPMRKPPRSAGTERLTSQWGAETAWACVR